MATPKLDAWIEEKLHDPAVSLAYLKEHLVDDGQGCFKEELAHCLMAIGAAHGICLLNPPPSHLKPCKHNDE